MTAPTNLRQFLTTLRKKNLVLDIKDEVDPHLELAEIHRRIVATEGPALFFHKVKGSSFPVVTNLFGTRERVELAFPNRPEKIVEKLITLLTKDFPPSLSKLWEKRNLLKKGLNLGIKKRWTIGPVGEAQMVPVDLEKLPMLTSWPEDGGPFITLPLVYTQYPKSAPPNLGMYRIHRYDSKTTGLHFQIGKGGGFHYHQAEKEGNPLPVSIFLGGPPALILSSIAPLPENVSELLLCGFLQDQKLDVFKNSEEDYPLIRECEFALVGKARPYKRKPEGPFGDHYGYYSLQHDFPVFECEKIYHRKDAIYPATVVGKPRQEDYFIGNYLQQLLSPLFPVVMPGVRKLWSYGEAGFHAISAAVLKERFHRESLSHAFRILGEGQLALTKFLLLTDQMVDLEDFSTLLQTVLERCEPQKDLYIFSNLSLDTLDYTGPQLNEGSRGILVGNGEKKRDLPVEWTAPLPRPFSSPEVFCPGCLVVELEEGADITEGEKALQDPVFSDWPLVILCDDSEKTIRNSTTFLWTVFTRFEPAADIYCSKTKVYRHHICYHFPILIDARMKPSYPKELLCDEQTYKKVTKRWSQYFAKPVEMGESQTADVY